MKRILLFINSLSSGGAEHQLSILANMLVENGYDVTLATISNTPDHYELLKDVKRVHIESDCSNRILKLLSIWKFFLRIKCDCVISYCQRNSFFALPALMLRSRKKLKVICGERNLSVGKQTSIEKVLWGFLYRRADFIVPNSYSQYNYIANKAPHLIGKLKTITNYTPIDKYIYHNQPDNAPLKIGIFCRYEKQKNCLAFLKATLNAHEKYPKKFTIHWYGNKNLGNQELLSYYNSLESFIKENGLQDIVHLNNAVKNVSELMPSFDAICLPSLYEGFSNTISEAICSGRPVICSAVSDNGLMVKNGENGFLFNPEDVEDMSVALCNFLSTTLDERISMGIKSRHIAETLFDKTKFINSYMGLIN